MMPTSGGTRGEERERERERESRRKRKSLKPQQRVYNYVHLPRCRHGTAQQARLDPTRPDSALVGGGAGAAISVGGGRLREEGG